MGKQHWHTHHTHTHTLPLPSFPAILLLEKHAHAIWQYMDMLNTPPPFRQFMHSRACHAYTTHFVWGFVFAWAYVNRPPGWDAAPPKLSERGREQLWRHWLCRTGAAHGGRRNHCLSFFIVYVNMSKLSVKWISWWRLFVFMNYMWRVWVVGEWWGIIMESIWSTLVLTHDIYLSMEWS